MIYIIDGQHFRNLMDYGIRNLTIYRDEVNMLNVFPVPDGDTGTNMVLTMQNGFASLSSSENHLSALSKKFAHAIVFGARGNSGVILSQFFKGFSECFFLVEEADCFIFASALENGVKCAYGAVSTPCEGTILTVLREATEYTSSKIASGDIKTIDDIITVFLKRAKISLENTPELLPILKSAGVVDSGGAGLVHIFEGMKKYLAGEKIEESKSSAPQAAIIDYSAYDENSVFDLGYCTELLVQLTKCKADFDYDSFKNELSALGESIVTSFNEGKVKVHIHTGTPENVFTLCHKYGEFLAIKVENMSVQHSEISKSAPSVYSEAPKGVFSVLCVAHDMSMKDCFVDMGADIVLMGDRLCPPSASDFIDAFGKTTTKTIFVFANGKNTYLSAMQASKLYENAQVIVVDTKSDTECYSVLPMIDFEESDTDLVFETISEVIENIKTVTVSIAAKDSCFDGTEIKSGDLFAFTGSKLLSIGNSYITVTTQSIDAVQSEGERDIITLFVSSRVPSSSIDKISSYVSENYAYTELAIVQTMDDFYDIVISFE